MGSRANFNLLPPSADMPGHINTLITDYNRRMTGTAGKRVEHTITRTSYQNLSERPDKVAMGHRQLSPIVLLSGDVSEQIIYSPVFLAGAFIVAATTAERVKPVEIDPQKRTIHEERARNLMNAYFRHVRLVTTNEPPPPPVKPHVTRREEEAVKRLHEGLAAKDIDAQYVSKLVLDAVAWYLAPPPAEAA